VSTGGSGGESADLGYVSGARIRARYLDGDDGSKQFVGWRDTQLGMDCTYLFAEDGEYRCLPSSILVGGYFTDANCGQPAALVAKTCAVPQYASVVTTTTTCTGAVQYRGNLVGSAAPYIYSWNGTCVDVTASLSSTYDAHVLTTVLATQFVAAHEVVE
jgi:hypothetical protein